MVSLPAVKLTADAEILRVRHGFIDKPAVVFTDAADRRRIGQRQDLQTKANRSIGGAEHGE